MLMRVHSSAEGPSLVLAYKVIMTFPQISLNSLGEYVGLALRNKWFSELTLYSRMSLYFVLRKQAQLGTSRKIINLFQVSEI